MGKMKGISIIQMILQRSLMMLSTLRSKKMGEPLEAKDRRRPAGLLMDKMTPNKQTGQMHACVIQVPENQVTCLI